MKSTGTKLLLFAAFFFLAATGFSRWVYNYVNPAYLSAGTVSSGKGPTLELPISVSMLNLDPLYKQTPGY